METIREMALRTYKDATRYGMQDTPMNWHIWKRAFDTADTELKKLRVGDVSNSFDEQMKVEDCQYYCSDECDCIGKYCSYGK